MSISASIDISILENAPSSNNCVLFFNELINHGWNPIKNKEVVFLPLGDADDFNWQKGSMDIKKILKLAMDKKKHKEVIGFELYWELTNVGVEFLFNTDNVLSFNLSINRRCIPQSNHTDVTWYLERLYPALNKMSWQINSITFNEYP